MKKKRAGENVKACPREDCEDPESCLHCRCELAATCSANFLHSLPCKRCVGEDGAIPIGRAQKKARATEGRPAGAEGGTLSGASARPSQGGAGWSWAVRGDTDATLANDAHHCEHICAHHAVWLENKPKGRDGLRRWRNKERPICLEHECLAAAQHCMGQKESVGRYVNRANCKGCYAARERKQRQDFLDGVDCGDDGGGGAGGGGDRGMGGAVIRF